MDSTSAERRELHQYGWRTGPVECRCSACEWSAAFIAVDASVPERIVEDFETHQGADMRMPGSQERYRGGGA